MKIAFISPIDSVNKDRIAFAAGLTLLAPTAVILLARLSLSTQVGAGGISEKQEGAKKQEQEMTTTTTTTAATEKPQVEAAVPQVRFSHPAVSSLARDCDQ